MSAVKESHLDVNGQRYFVRDTGEGDETVFLAHGMPDDGDLWRYLLPELASKNYRVVAPDNLGCGKSARPIERERYKSSAIVSNYVAILDTLKISKAHFVGHDIGAVLGWEFAMTYPERLHSFVTMTVGHPCTWAEQTLTMDGARWCWYMFLNQMDNWGDILRAGGGRIGSIVMDFHPDRETLMPRMMEPGGLEGHMMIDKANPFTDFLMAYVSGAFDGMPPVDVPVLGIAGTSDPLMWLSQLRDSGGQVAKRWKFETVEGGHWFPLEQPDRTTDLVLSWLEENPAS